MADSENHEGKSIKGKYGTYFIRKNLGKGGNGKVYAVDIKEKTHEGNLLSSDRYALKILKNMEGYEEDKRKKRLERFKREAETVCQKLEDIDGIVPILDSSFENEKNEYSFQWYLMPRANEFKYKTFSTEEIISLFLQIAETISRIHQRGFSHRDIKIDNLLIYHNRLCLTDFGLLWADEFNTDLTDSGECIGPMAIRPPELEAPVVQDGSMFKASDVYLFAKTLWIALTGNRNGFYKRYVRNDDDIYFKSKLEISCTLEPLHLLMEGATWDDYDKRITIDECARLLKAQIDIFEERMPYEELSMYQYDEAFHRSQQLAEPDELVFTTDSKLFDLMKEMVNSARLQIEEPGRAYDVGALLSVRHVAPYVYELTVDRISGALNTNKRKLYFRFKNLHMSNEGTFEAKTELLNYDDPYSKVILCNRLNTLWTISEDAIGIDGEYTLKFVP